MSVVDILRAIIDLVSIALIVTGAFFFIAGTVGLLRFPDLFTRLHALTKADNLGLGLIVVGLVLQADSWSAAVQIVVIWFLVLLSSASSAHLLVRDAHHRGRKPWTTG